MRRPTLQILLALLLAAAFAAPVEAATAGAPARESLTGVLEAAYLDDFKAGHDTQRFDLRTDHGTVRLDFPGRGPQRLVGAVVTVTGTRDRGVLRVATNRRGPDLRVRSRRTADETWAATPDGATGATAARPAAR